MLYIIQVVLLIIGYVWFVYHEVKKYQSVIKDKKAKPFLHTEELQ
jgi:hypothetical protein